MVKQKIIEEEPITIAEVKSILEKEAKKEELDIRENKTLEYAKRIAKISKTKVKEQKKKLEGLGMSKLKPSIIVKIIDTQPASIEELKVILSDSAKLFKEEELKKILKVLTE
ncbi:hypothetical protein J7K74_04015 [Candidatus Woesearchaeota archaeon]|nr:hypothetical protein [Candidatus Woesearchaeota archaeon]